MISRRARDEKVWIAYNNLVGGQDELVFDGNGLIVNDLGIVVKNGKRFEEDLILYDLHVENAGKPGGSSKRLIQSMGNGQSKDQVYIKIPCTSKGKKKGVLK